MFGWALAVIILVTLSTVTYIRYRINKERISAQASVNYKEIQRKRLQTNSDYSDSTVLEFVEGGLARDKTDAARDLEKRLYCAGWNITRPVFHIIEVATSFFLVSFSYFLLSTPFVILSIFAGPLICRGILDFIVERKARAFEQDFSHFLMSMVSLLKTGMTPVVAMENAGKALDEGSPVRYEVESLIESLRNGLNEERAFSRFADTIYSSMIETFVQIMLVGKRFGGSLADSLERLAALVRKKQAFQMEAKASVAQARMSMWVVIGLFILGIGVLFGVLEEFRNSVKSGFGRSLLHFVICVNIVAAWLFSKITKIKV